MTSLGSGFSLLLLWLLLELRTRVKLDGFGLAATYEVHQSRILWLETQERVKLRELAGHQVSRRPKAGSGFYRSSTPSSLSEDRTKEVVY